MPLWVVHALTEGAGFLSLRTTLIDSGSNEVAVPVVCSQCREKEHVEEESDRHS